MAGQFTRDRSIDIDDLIREQENRAQHYAAQQTKDATSRVAVNEIKQPARPVGGLVIEDDEITEDSSVYEAINTQASEPVVEKQPEYDGPGAVIDAEEYTKYTNSISNQNAGMVVSGVKQDTMDAAVAALDDMDEQIAKQKVLAEKLKAQGITKESKNNAQSPQEVVNIYIDKSRIGEPLFTEEEQKRITYASKINVVETTDVNYKTLKIKRKDTKANKAETLHILDKAFERTLSPFIAIGSGYMGKMTNCSVNDIMNIGRQIDAKASLTSMLERWKVLYAKMKYCSIGKFETFDDFLKNTAYDDYENLQFALICASFPEDTTMRFTCPKCGSEFTITVPNRSLLRTDRVDDQMAETVKTIVSADTFVERAKEVHENALFNTVTRMSLNENSDNFVFMDLYSPSAYDAIYRTYQDLTNPDKDNEEYESYVEIIKYIKAIYIATEVDEETNELIYTEYDEADDIFEILKRFTEVQLNRIGTYMNESYMTHKYTYGIPDVTCTSCKHVIGDYPLNMDRLLFLKVHRQ